MTSIAVPSSATGRGLRGLLLVLVGALSPACGSQQVQILHGETQLRAASAAMRDGGVVFAPYVELPPVGSELTQEHYRCSHVVNAAVGRALAERFEVHPGPARRNPRTQQPRWARGLDGPRVAIHVESLRCGRVRGEAAYLIAAAPSGGGAAADAGEVVLAAYDRSTGQAIIRIRASASDGDGFEAARVAVERAIAELEPGGD